MNTLTPRLLFSMLFALLLLLPSRQSFARGEYQEVTQESGEMFAMEIELAGHRSLGNILYYFDLNLGAEDTARIQQELTLSEIDAYLTPATFDTLPKAVRATLERDLNIAGNIQLESKPILARDGKPQQTKLTAPSGIVLPGKTETPPRGLILPKSLSPATGTSPKPLVVDESVRRQMDWEIVIKRWKAMSDLERRKLVRPENFSNQMKASLILQQSIAIENFELKKDLPQKIKELFGRLNWNIELGGVIEFRHKTTVATPDQLHADRELFSDLAGIRRFIDDPAKAVPAELEFSYHWHGSRYGSSLEQVVPLEQRIRLINMALIERADSMLNSDVYGYGSSLGPIELAAPNHIESRQHAESPRGEVDRIVRWMRLSREEALSEAKTHLEARSKLLQAKILDSIVSRPDSRELRNEIVALAFADSKGYKALSAKVNSTERRILNEGLLSALDNETIVRSLPMLNDKAFLKENIGTILDKLLRTMNPGGLHALKQAATNSAFSEAEFDSLMRIQFAKAMENSKWIFNKVTVFEAFREYGGENTKRLLLKGVEYCATSACLHTVADLFEQLIDSSPGLQRNDVAEIRSAIRSTPRFVETVGQARLAPYITAQRIDLLRWSSEKSESDALAALLQLGRVSLGAKLEIIKQLIRLDYEFNDNDLANVDFEKMKVDFSRGSKEIRDLIVKKNLHVNPNDIAAVRNIGRTARLVAVPLIEIKPLCPLGFQKIGTDSAGLKAP